MKTLSNLTLLIFSSTIFAANAQSLKDLSTKQKAILEAKAPNAANSLRASDAQVSGMLQLKDPRKEVVTRNWHYFAAFSMQSHQAEGRAIKQDMTTFDLGRNDSTIMPGMEFGVISGNFLYPQMTTNWGFLVKGSLASQPSQIALNSGLKVDARLNTTLLSTGPVFFAKWNSWDRWAISLSPQIGTISYTQTSSNDFVAFSKSGTYSSVSVGLNYNLSPTWTLLADWTQRTMNGTSDLSLQKDNFEIGTRVIW